MARGDDIQRRLLALAVSVTKLVPELSRTVAGEHYARQLLRSTSSCAANYAEARGAETGRDFVHKLGIVLKELNETEFWFTLVLQSELRPGSTIVPLLNEARELSAIIATSIRTASRGKRFTRHPRHH